MTEQETRCSFCGALSTERFLVITCVGGNICDRCIEEVRDVLGEAREAERQKQKGESK